MCRLVFLTYTLYRFKNFLPGRGAASKKKCLNVGMSFLGLGMGSPLVATASNTAGKAIWKIIKKILPISNNNLKMQANCPMI